MPLAGRPASAALPPYALRRVLAVAVVAGAHGLALLWLAGLSVTRTDLAASGEALLVLLLPAPEPERPDFMPPLPQRPAAVRAGRAPPALPAPVELAPAAEAAAPPGIDWSAAARAAAARSIDEQEAEARQRRFGMPAPSPLFAAPMPRTPGIAWDYAATHRLEGGPSGSLIFHVNEHCAVGFWIILPFFGCQIGKIPVRGDLFDHLHDNPDPGEPR